MSRTCARPGCSTAASATLLYDYTQRTASLESLATERHPMEYDLCDAHADSLTVPQGWRLEDQRVRGSSEDYDDRVTSPTSYDAAYGSTLLS